MSLHAAIVRWLRLPAGHAHASTVEPLAERMRAALYPLGFAIGDPFVDDLVFHMLANETIDECERFIVKAQELAHGRLN